MNVIATLLSIALIAAIIMAAVGVVAWAFNLLAGLFSAPPTDADLSATLAQVAAEQAEADAYMASRRRHTLNND